MNLKNSARLFAGAIITVVSSGLSGCAVVDSVYGEDRIRSPLGNSLGNLEHVEDMAFHDGRLLLIQRGSHRGLSVVDTGTQKVVEFFPLQIAPSDMACDSLGRVFLYQSDNGYRVIGLFDLTHNLYAQIHTPSHWGSPKFSLSGGHAFLTDEFDHQMNRLVITPTSMFLTPDIADVSAPRSVAVSGRTVFTALNASLALRTMSLDDLEGPQDSIPLRGEDTAGDSQGGVAAVIAWKSRIFAAYTNDSGSFVAIIDPETRTPVATIPLSLTHPKGGEILNGVWYLYGTGSGPYDSNGIPTQPGGVETIILDQESHGEIIATETELGGYLMGFVPAGDHVGYVRLYEYGGGDIQVRRIRF